MEKLLELSQLSKIVLKKIGLNSTTLLAIYSCFRYNEFFEFFN